MLGEAAFFNFFFKNTSKIENVAEILRDSPGRFGNSRRKKIPVPADDGHRNFSKKLKSETQSRIVKPMPLSVRVPARLPRKR